MLQTIKLPGEHCCKTNRVGPACLFVFCNFAHILVCPFYDCYVIVVSYLSGAADYPCFRSLLKQLVGPLSTQLSDRRSSIVKQVKESCFSFMVVSCSSIIFLPFLKETHSS